MLGDDAWLAELARQLQSLGVSALMIMSRPPDEAAAEAESAGVAAISIADTEAKIRDAVMDADIAQVLVCAPSGMVSNLVDQAFIESIGSRAVLRLPDTPQGGASGHSVLDSRRARPFAPGVTRQAIDALVDAGAVVEAIDDAGRVDALPLAAVSPDGTVNLQPGYRSPASEDTVVALVGGRPSEL